ncbi:hypothetical protein Glove_67g85 [Diversispora epigaea]|uniref:Protein kinase domain-containing protein n=1 Tax=Diversispora epigaea TaxID=1348612 RepID=A0A397JAA5_9GLOM|nr:hypothetical protein Glove_67g85 [Diversispora epigaea]
METIINSEYDGKNLQNDWTSGNDKIDKFIQNSQLNSYNGWQVIECIPYDRFKYGKQIDKGGFGTIHYARWIDGQIKKWDIENQQWDNKSEVALKKFDNFANFNDVLNEMAIHLKTWTEVEYAVKGNLREYLNINFNDINIYTQISDFGLSKLIGANPNNPEKKNIAPEVLVGEEYTKAADEYSFGIIAYEIVTGIPPYPNIPHDKDLAMKICNGLRPKIPFHFSQINYKNDYEVEVDYLEKGKNKDSEIVIQIKKAEEFPANQNHNLRSIWKSISHIFHWRKESTNTTITTTTPLNYKTHPEAIYTSRLLNYSNLPKPKNEENFEKELEELTKPTSASIAVASKLHVPDF